MKLYILSLSGLILSSLKSTIIFFFILFVHFCPTLQIHLGQQDINRILAHHNLITLLHSLLIAYKTE